MRRSNAFIATVMALVVLAVVALSACSESSNTSTVTSTITSTITETSTSTITSTTAKPNEVSLGQEFTLSVGGNVTVSGEDMAIKFVEVASDSRCPQGVTCVWAGEASCLLEFSKGSTTNKVVLTQSGSVVQNVKRVLDAYEVTFRVEPYPVAGRQIAQNEYRLVMTVTKSGQSNTEIRPAPIHEVKVSIAKSNPPQIIVYIKGGLSDGCTTFNELKTNRAGTTVTISVTTKRPKNVACPRSGSTRLASPPVCCAVATACSAPLCAAAGP